MVASSNTAPVPIQTILPLDNETENLKENPATTNIPESLEIVFEKTKPGQYVLVKATIDGEAYLYLVSGEGEITQKFNMDADWAASNDGTQLLVMPYSSGQFKNFNSLTREWTDINIDAECYEGNWSPDRKYIALSCSNGGSIDIYLFDMSSNSMSKITDCQKQDMACKNPSWSFDGQWLAYWKVEVRSGTDLLHEIYYFNTSCIKEENCPGKEIGPITSDSNPTWSPNNELLAYYENKIDVYKIDKFGSNSLFKTINFDLEGEENLQNIFCSPDGKYLVSTGAVWDSKIYIFSLSNNTSDAILLKGENIVIVGWLVIS